MGRDSVSKWRVFSEINRERQLLYEKGKKEFKFSPNAALLL